MKKKVLIIGGGMAGFHVLDNKELEAQFFRAGVRTFLQDILILRHFLTSIKNL